MKKIIMFFCFCFFLPNFTHAMLSNPKNKSSSSSNALPDNLMVRSTFDPSKPSIHKIPRRTIRKSITLFIRAKYLQKENQIGISCTGSEGLILFNKACLCLSKKNQDPLIILSPLQKFLQFFNRLKTNEQRLLICTAGGNELNSPEITALLIESTMVKEPIRNYLAAKSKKEMVRLLRANIIQSNIYPALYDQPKLLQSTTTVLCPNGVPYTIPADFQACPTLMTSDIFYPYSVHDNFEQGKKITHLVKHVGNKTYTITSFNINDRNNNNTQTDRFIECTQINKKIYENKEIIENVIIQKEEINNKNGIVCGALCTDDGKHIAIITNKSRVILYSINHQSENPIETFVTFREKKFNITDVQFNTLGTLLFILFRHENVAKSRVIRYDTASKVSSRVKFDQTSYIPFCITGSDRIVFISQTSMEHNQTLLLWDTLAENNKELSSISITKEMETIKAHFSELNLLSAYQYIIKMLALPDLNKLIVQLHDGHFIYIKHGDKKIESLDLRINENQCKLDEASLQQTQHGRFVISHAIGPKKVSILSIWDVLQKKIILSFPVSTMGNNNTPLIIMSADGASFITNCHNNNWIRHTLYEEHDTNFISWLEGDDNIFNFYMLWRLYKNYEEHEHTRFSETSSIQQFFLSLPKSVSKEKIMRCLGCKLLKK